MAVVQRGTPNLSGMYGNIQQGLSNMAALERNRPDTTTAIAKTFGGLFEKMLMKEMDMYFDNRNKVKITEEYIGQAQKEYGFSNEFADHLRKNHLNKEFDMTDVEARFEKRGQEFQKRQDYQDWLKTVPQEDQALAQAAPDEYKKAQVESKFKEPEEDKEDAFDKERAKANRVVWESFLGELQAATAENREPKLHPTFLKQVKSVSEDFGMSPEDIDEEIAAVKKNPGFFMRMIRNAMASGATTGSPFVDMVAKTASEEETKPLSTEKAQEFLELAGGDREKARMLAKKAGYRF